MKVQFTSSSYERCLIQANLRPGCGSPAIALRCVDRPVNRRPSPRLSTFCAPAPPPATEFEGSQTPVPLLCFASSRTYVLLFTNPLLPTRLVCRQHRLHSAGPGDQGQLCGFSHTGHWVLVHPALVSPPRPVMSQHSEGTWLVVHRELVPAENPELRATFPLSGMFTDSLPLEEGRISSTENIPFS